MSDPKLASLPARAPVAFTARRVPRGRMAGLCRDRSPRAGDLVLARVESLAQHRRLHLPNGRRRQLFAGDDVIVVYAPRYAPRQFEAVVPNDLGPCHLVAAGGVAAQALSWHDRIHRGPTEITPHGLVVGPDGAVLNVADFALGRPAPARGGAPAPAPTVIAFAGTAMDSGKTTSAARLALGLARAGRQVGYAKLTGTGAAGDPWLVADAGADPVLDFTDVGHASTYLLGLPELERITRELLAQQAARGVDVVVLEIADGLLQRETAMLIDSPVLRAGVDAFLFAAADAMGAAGGCARLRRAGHRVLGVCGLLSSAPLQIREANELVQAPVLRLSELSDPATAQKLVEMARRRDTGCA